MADRPRGMVKGTVLGKPVLKECALIAPDGRDGLGTGAEGPFEQGVHSLLAFCNRQHHSARLPGIAKDDA